METLNPLVETANPAKEMSNPLKEIQDPTTEIANPLTEMAYPLIETVTEYLASPNFVRKYDKRNKNLTTLSSVVFCYFCEVKF